MPVSYTHLDVYKRQLLEKHPMMCLKQKLFDQNGEVDEDALLYEVHSDLRDFCLLYTSRCV